MSYRIAEQYALSNLIYKSAESYIYMLVNINNRKEYTLKVIKKKPSIEMVIQKLMNISHPQITEIVLSGESEKYLYIIKPYVKGVTLEEYVNINGVLNEHDTLRVKR